MLKNKEPLKCVILCFYGSFNSVVCNLKFVAARLWSLVLVIRLKETL